MLEKCLKNFEDDPADTDINIQVTCACCGATVKDSNIEEENAKDVESSNSEEQESVKGINIGAEKEIKKDILQSKTPRKSRCGSCFSCCFKRSIDTDEAMVERTTDLHFTSPRT
jgi:hypothetical protein